ncbi:MAG: glycosyltransferase, partial [Acidimicrobiales bacterium]
MSGKDRRATPRLLVVSDTLSGGTGVAVVRHVEWFVRKGWSVELAAPSGEEAAVRAPNHRPIDMPITVRDIRGVARAARALGELRGAFRPDIVHTHGARSFAAMRPVQRSAPFVTLHGIHPVSSDPAGYRMLRRPGLALLSLLAARAFSV